VALGHEVVAEVSGVDTIPAATQAQAPDVALVAVDQSSEYSLELVDRIVADERYPVIALLAAADPDFVREAAKRGIYAYIVDAKPEDLQGAIDITTRRFAAYHELMGAFGRRAVIEQAKGVLMGKHAIDGDTAFGMLRTHSQHSGLPLADVAAALVQSHVLLHSPATGRASPGLASQAGRHVG
jgi:AmiR/NasT family two-component response regulator